MNVQIAALLARPPVQQHKDSLGSITGAFQAHRFHKTTSSRKKKIGSCVSYLFQRLRLRSERMAIFSNNFYFKWSVVSSIVIVIYTFVGVMLSVNDVIRYGTFRELVINMRYPSDKSNSFSPENTNRVVPFWWIQQSIIFIYFQLNYLMKTNLNTSY
jgi:hypothetical protein